MTTRAALLSLSLVALFLGGSLLVLAPAGQASLALPGPHAVHPPVLPGTVSAAPRGAPPSHTLAAPASGAGPAAAPSAGCGNTPSGSYNWATQDFFTDVSTTFYVPGVSSLSGANFQPVPCTNVIPTYLNGFWVNLTTNVPVTTAEITIWGTGWPTPGSSAPDIKNFAASSPAVLPMYIEPPFYRTVTFFFNDYKNFWPGSTVYFNISLTSTNATPSTIYTANRFSGLSEAYTFNGGVDNATWSFYVASPFSAQPVGRNLVNFSNILSVYTSPSALTQPAYEPNPQQAIQVYLAANNVSGAGAPPIPMAQAQFTLSGAIVGVYLDNFGPANHTLMWLNQKLGPYPATEVQFNITVWLPWEGGAIDYVYSPVFKFNWSANGGWWNQVGGLEANLNFSTTPSLGVPGSNPDLGTGVPVNVSIHEPIENVTIGSAALHYRYNDSNGVSYGTLPLAAAGPNTSYVIIPGLPPGGEVQFSVVAKDIYGNAIPSGTYVYHETGALATPPPPGYGLLYFEVIDVATGQLVPAFNYTVANASWSETTVSYPYGFGNPVLTGGRTALDVSIGTYVVTVRAFGLSQTWKGSVSDSNPFVVVFYLASQPLSPTYSAPLGSLTISAGVGLAAAGICSVPVIRWFRERRRKAEAEQRRISL